MTIRQEIEARTGREIAVGAIYTSRCAGSS